MSDFDNLRLYALANYGVLFSSDIDKHGEISHESAFQISARANKKVSLEYNKRSRCDMCLRYPEGRSDSECYSVKYFTWCDRLLCYSCLSMTRQIHLRNYTRVDNIYGENCKFNGYIYHNNHYFAASVDITIGHTNDQYIYVYDKFDPTIDMFSSDHKYIKYQSLYLSNLNLKVIAEYRSMLTKILTMLNEVLVNDISVSIINLMLLVKCN